MCARGQRWPRRVQSGPVTGHTRGPLAGLEEQPEQHSAGAPLSRIPAASPRLPHGFPTASARLPRGFPAASPRLPHGFPAASARLPHGFPTASARLPRGFRSASPRLPHSFRSASPRLPHGRASPQPERAQHGLPLTLEKNPKEVWGRTRTRSSELKRSVCNKAPDPDASPVVPQAEAVMRVQDKTEGPPLSKGKLGS